ncbi:MAG: DUF349 domain-containing protein [Flammeovirgaceae bacterium]|nr:MAG: DUF349 domain-containing protein [Flammeovirgaceae bacterium]
MEDEKIEAEGMDHQAGLIDHDESAVLKSEADLVDHSEDVFGAGTDAPDYQQYSKEQLIASLKELAVQSGQHNIEPVLREIRIAYEALRQKEKDTAFNRYLLDGGSPDGFAYKGDALDASFDQVVKVIREKRQHYIKQQEDQKNENYKRKLDLLEQLRQLADTDDVQANQFDKFKQLQTEWKNVGAVPGIHAKTLWANYHALVDRFYDNQSIYFELKELDRKKNLEAKLDLCARAEKLAEVDKIRDAIRELNELHHEFKHIGPVPREEKESVWTRFKAASDAVYARRDEYLKQLQQDLHSNLEKKTKLCDEVQAFASFQSERIKEWNQKTKEILELQKKWEAAGSVPRSKTKEINKRFWTAFKTFFHTKSVFFKELDAQRTDNLKKKQELVQRALALRDSTDWEKTSAELKKLQQAWKDIGPVPDKHRDKVFKEFKEACDYFFEQRRGQRSKQEQEQLDNLKAKEVLCEQIEQTAAQGTATVEQLHEFERQFSAIGFVPRNRIAAIRSRYQAAVEKMVNSITVLTDEERSRLLLQNQLLDLKDDPMGEKKLFAKEQSIRKKIVKVENDIALWRNNLEFFARSKNADGLREEFNSKIKVASNQLDSLKQQLKLLRSAV